MNREISKRLSDLLAGVEAIKVRGAEGCIVKGLAYNSMTVKPGYLFAAISGAKADGHTYIGDAVKRGAAAVIAEREEAVPAEVAAVIVPNSRRALAAVSAAFFDDPSSRIKVAGVTGTKGKTTVAYLIYEILSKAGYRPGLIGTIEYRVGQRVIASTNTTPECLDIQRMLCELESEGGNAMSMEVSSHALDQGRVDHVHFQTAVLTNLTRDHTDYHKTVEAYKMAKASLFDRLSGPQRAILNVDDEFGAELARRERCCAFTYALESDADMTAEKLECSLEGTRFVWRWKDLALAVRLPLAGVHNVYNFLGAAGACVSIGVEPEDVVAAAEAFSGVPGRLERVDEGQDFVVLVDYAHTDDALEKVLGSLRPLTPSRLIVVFGCGGERDRTKRPAMAEVAERLADRVIVTSDNPRGEDPMAIIEEIKRGFKKDAYTVEADRRRAIELAIGEARRGDVVLLAGKGHENYQKLAEGMIHFDDREEARKAIQGLLGRK